MPSTLTENLYPQTGTILEGPGSLPITISVKIPDNVYSKMQFAMHAVHITFEKGFNNILVLLENPPVHDLYNFLGYARSWATSLLFHHESEDEVMFPFLMTKLDFKSEVEQHKVIHSTCTKFADRTLAMQNDTSLFDAAELSQILLENKDLIFQHLSEEVQDLAPENLKAFTEQELTDMTLRLNKYSKTKADPFTTFVYMRCHTPPEYKGFPPLPWFVRSFLVPWVFASKHKGYWKYAPYSLS
ncbi:uncharacterized protein V2V93DRAFT_373325 [Kockiozyma suomiensis]|uniref:uncharacterized protein n=1 Tax=Kockiozyma suomiensis TaxID=1337062 RepID=UPI00334358FC